MTGSGDKHTIRAIPLFNPEISGNEWKYVKECLDTAWVSSVGAFVGKFESMLAQRAGTEFAIATMNGTAALHIGMLAAGIEPGDEILVSTLTFIASANAIRYAGAWPVFIDAEPRHWQIDCNLLEHFLTKQCEWKDGKLRNRSTGRRVRAIVPVHVLGHPVDMDPILELARNNELLVMEDAAEALGVKYKGKPAGGLADLGCISFNGNKLVTAGGGGVILTNNRRIAEKAKHLTTQAKSDPLEYIHDEIGFNYRMCNVLAAIGCAQLEQLDQFIAAKRKQALDYVECLKGINGIRFYEASSDAFCTYWLNTVEVDQRTFGLNSRQLCRALQDRGIQTRPLWQPMHLSPAHRDSESVTRGVADRLFANCLSLPSSVPLTCDDVAHVCRTIASLGQDTQQHRHAA